MGIVNSNSRSYSPKTIDRLRQESDPASGVEDVLAGVNETTTSKPSREEPRQDVKGLAKSDLDDLGERKARAAKARYRAKRRRGRLVFK